MLYSPAIKFYKLELELLSISYQRIENNKSVRTSSLSGAPHLWTVLWCLISANDHKMKYLLLLHSSKLFSDALVDFHLEIQRKVECPNKPKYLSGKISSRKDFLCLHDTFKRKTSIYQWCVEKFPKRINKAEILRFSWKETLRLHSLPPDSD